MRCPLGQGSTTRMNCVCYAARSVRCTKIAGEVFGGDLAEEVDPVPLPEVALVFPFP